MESLYLLVPLSVALVFVTGWAFWRALEGGQFDDLERPAHDIIMDNDSASDDRPRKSGTDHGFR
jgi:cbb3-type cytochrome oxidase maturation protein